MWQSWSCSVSLHHAWATSLPLISECVCCFPAVDASQCCCQSIYTLRQPSHQIFYYNKCVSRVCVSVRAPGGAIFRLRFQNTGWCNEISWICAQCISMFAGLYSRHARTNKIMVQEEDNQQPCISLMCVMEDELMSVPRMNYSLMGWNRSKYYQRVKRWYQTSAG